MILRRITTSYSVIFLSLIVVLLFLLPVFIVSAQEAYQPLAPLPNIDYSASDPSSFFNGLFRYGVIIAAFLAVFMLVLAGFQYMTTDAVAKKGDAKETIVAALSGLFLILVTSLILGVINPDILTLRITPLTWGIRSDGASNVQGTLANPDSQGRAYELVNRSAGCSNNTSAGYTLIGEASLQQCPASNPSISDVNSMCCSYQKTHDASTQRPINATLNGEDFVGGQLTSYTPITKEYEEGIRFKIDALPVNKTQRDEILKYYGKWCTDKYGTGFEFTTETGPSGTAIGAVCKSK